MNILVVDDSKIFIESLSMLLRKQMPNASFHFAYDGPSAIKMLDEINPKLVILDVNMPGMNGLEVGEYINTHYPNILIIILTNVDGKAMILNLTKVARGILSKVIDGQELKKCIDTVLAGDKYFCESAKKIILNNSDSFADLPNIHLSDRELVIIEMLMAGKTSGEISTALGIKEKTIKSYREELLRKTKTKNTSELVAFAIKNSLLYKS